MLARFVLLLFSFAWVPCVLVCMRPIRSIGCYLICWKWANCAIFLGAAFVAATADVSVHFFLLVDATRRTITHNTHISFLLFCSSVFVRHQKRRSEKNRNEYLIWSYLHSTAGWSSIACVTQKQKSFSRRTFHQTNVRTIFFLLLIKTTSKRVQRFGALCYVALSNHCAFRARLRLEYFIKCSIVWWIASALARLFLGADKIESRSAYL